jgi:CheY-like chemotaxis protein
MPPRREGLQLFAVLHPSRVVPDDNGAIESIPTEPPFLGYIVIVSERSLLVVDADPAVHEVVSGALSREDRKIQNAYDGPEALECLRAVPYDLVLAGAGRNGFDSMKLLRRMRAIRPDTKVIVTGEPNAVKALDAIRGRAYNYFHKPLQAAPLAEMVHQALQCSSWQNDVKVVSARKDWIGLEVRCKLEAADRAVHLLGELEIDMAPDVWEDVSSAFRELLLNAIEHGGKGDARKRVQVSVLRTAKALVVHLQDPGKGFSLEKLEHSALANPEDDPTASAF